MAWDSLYAGLGHDDLMNLTHAWRPGLWALLRDNLEFYQVGSAHRPLGEVFYWALFRLFGFDPVPYRVACLALLVGNTVLLFGVCRLLGCPSSAATGAAFFHGYHYGFWALYYNTGTCYDLLAFLFFFLAIGAYVFARNKERPGFCDVCAVCLLTVASLNAKEISIALPAVLFAYEALWRRSLRVGGRWLLAPVAAIATVYAAGHFLGDRSLNTLSSYDPQFRFDMLGEFLGRTFREVFYEYDHPAWLAAAVGLGTAAWICAATRRREPVLGLAFFVLGAVPIAFITPRSLYAAYIPLAGLAMTYAYGLSAVSGWIAKRTHWMTAPLVYAAVASAIVSTHLWIKSHGAADRMMARQAEEIQAIRLRLRELVPDPEPGSRILLLEDPFLQLEDAWFKEWASVFLVELMYEGVHVDQAFRMDPPPDQAAIAKYDYVLTAREARLEPVRVE